jgi:hypothetical protein
MRSTLNYPNLVEFECRRGNSVSRCRSVNKVAIEASSTNTGAWKVQKSDRLHFPTPLNPINPNSTFAATTIAREFHHTGALKINVGKASLCLKMEEQCCPFPSRL